MSELQDQSFGKEGVECSLGYQAMEPVNPLPSDHTDVEITTTELEDAAAALTKDSEERLGKGPGEVVREYKAETLDGKKLDESLTVSTEQAAADLTAARNREENYLDSLDRDALAGEIDRLRSGNPSFEELQAQSPPEASSRSFNRPIQYGRDWKGV